MGIFEYLLLAIAAAIFFIPIFYDTEKPGLILFKRTMDRLEALEKNNESI